MTIFSIYPDISYIYCATKYNLQKQCLYHIHENKTMNGLQSVETLINIFSQVASPLASMGFNFKGSFKNGKMEKLIHYGW